jgi:hypothetical protein
MSANYKIIVSLTTIPERLEKDLPKTCIESILKQTVKPDMIIVNIPKVSKKGIKYSEKLAKQLLDLDSIVRVQFGVQDIGPITKLVPTLNFIENNCLDDVQMVLVDDDCTYNERMIENLINTKNKHPEEYVIGTSGRLKQRNKLEFVGHYQENRRNQKPEHMYVDVIETFAGVLYDYALFKNTNFMQWLFTLPEFVMLADDIILSSWAKKQGKKLYKIVQNECNYVKHDPKKTTELNIINIIGGNNDKVYNYFEDKLKLEELIERSNNTSFAEFISRFELNKQCMLLNLE